MENFYTKLYELLVEEYGLQGWWPIINKNNIMEYTPGDYSKPSNYEERVEIVMGCILTQNTTWNSAVKAIYNLHGANIYTFEDLLDVKDKKLVELITPARFKNQKSNYLRNVSSFLIDNDNPCREELLKVKGVGNETCDAILLYAYNKAEFVMDSYTTRILVNYGLCDEKSSYNYKKKLFTENIEEDVVYYKEYHSLLDRHAYTHYKKKPYTKDLFYDELIGLI